MYVEQTVELACDGQESLGNSRFWVGMPAGRRGLTGRPRSKARSKAEQQQQQRQSAKLHSPVGAGLPAMAVYQSINVLAGTPPSQASQLPQVYAHASTIRSAVRPPRFAFDLRRPVKPRWPSSDIDLGGNPAGRRVSRAGPWMAHRGGPPNQCRMAGTPSLGEVPSGGARALLVTFGALFQK